MSVALLVSVAACGAGDENQPPETRSPTETPTPAQAAIWVAPGGDDNAPGTLEEPLRTPQVAVDRLDAGGGTVVLGGGTYPGERIVINNRSNVTIRAAEGEEPILDHAGAAVPEGPTGVIEVQDGSNIAIVGLTITGYRTASTDATPIGIHAAGAISGLRIEGNHVHQLGNDNPTLGGFDINAHGIAVYGTSATAPTTGVVIRGNEVDHLTLGSSEALVLNGNIDGFEISDNNIHDVNNIAIDVIGFEETIPGEARWSDVNRARNGSITGNTVRKVRSEGNPAYWEDGEWCNCAGGIYIDGAKGILIADNTIDEADLGIEIASEWPQGRANGITVTGNTVTRCRYVGLAIGGYDSDRGEAFDIIVSGNTFRDNNTLRNSSPEILLQHFVHDTKIVNNTVTTTATDYPIVLARVVPVGPAERNARIVLDDNDYGGPASAAEAVFVWEGVEHIGLTNYQEATGQDAGSTWQRR